MFWENGSRLEFPKLTPGVVIVLELVAIEQSMYDPGSFFAGELETHQ
ncbi:MAG TPA: hypothetical protein V6D50_12830 [Chroococcales cyanobacterium]